MAEPTYDSVAKLCASGLAGGAQRHSLSHFEWDIAGKCERSLTREISARPLPEPGRTYVDIDRSTPVTLWMTLHVRCRRCSVCLKHRRLDWQSRARHETALAQRTWFATLTLSPQSQYQFLCRASLRAEHSEVEFQKLDSNERFRRVVAEVYPEVQKMLKRWRKQTGVELRYLFIAEEHGGGGQHHGLPHFHLLLHEQSTDKVLRYEDLKYRLRKPAFEGEDPKLLRLGPQWEFGFSDFQLLRNEGRAGYVTKYMSKDIRDRPRASANYGRSLKTASPLSKRSDVQRGGAFRTKWIVKGGDAIPHATRVL